MNVGMRHNFSNAIRGPYGSVIGYQDFEGIIDGILTVDADNARATIKTKNGNILFTGSVELLNLMVDKGYINLNPPDPWETN